MQTFLPYKNFYQSARCLDRQRLGKQRVEVLQLLNSIKIIQNGGKPKGWANHPCRKMWQNYSNALVHYGLDVCIAWKERGYKDTCFAKIAAHYDKSLPLIYPDWLGNMDFHTAHKSMLIQKKPDWYKKIWPNTPDDLEYIWPV